MSLNSIPFNWPHLTGKELEYIEQARAHGRLAGDGPFTHRCQEWLQDNAQTPRALLTHSCTAALELAALLIDIQPGDEVIMPSYTFVSTANAFVLRGAVPVFVDIRADTLNIDETIIETAITSKTVAIVPVHYAGISCEMEAIMAIARQYNLKVVEDAAQGVMAKYKGQPLGSIGDLGAFSFHETKNVISGEGGAILVNDSQLASRAEIIREKGTDRAQFGRGEVDKYTWQDIGSSFLPGELTAAFLWAQLESAEAITAHRLSLWNQYHRGLESLELSGKLRRPTVPSDCEPNGHLYYVLIRSDIQREHVLKAFSDRDISSVFHYVPLHDSPAGRRYSRSHGTMAVTEDSASRLIRLPLWVGLTAEQQDRVLDVLHSL